MLTNLQPSGHACGDRPAEYHLKPSAIFEAWLTGEAGLLKVSNGAFPGGSKERVRRAGNAVREGEATTDDYAVIDMWRAAHRPVLNTFQAILRTRTRGTEIVVAQRQKRKNSW